MLITDHLSLLPMTGPNPLRGPNLDEFGPRFPDMSQVYDKDLLALAQQVSDEQDLNVRRGVYAGLSGPSFETARTRSECPLCLRLSSRGTAVCACWEFPGFRTKLILTGTTSLPTKKCWKPGK